MFPVYFGPADSKWQQSGHNGWLVQWELSPLARAVSEKRINAVAVGTLLACLIHLRMSTARLLGLTGLGKPLVICRLFKKLVKGLCWLALMGVHGHTFSWENSGLTMFWIIHLT